MNAAEAWGDAGLMPNPPKDDGREAFVQAQSVKGQPTRSDTASVRVSSNSSKTSWIRGGGQVRSRCAILGRERQERRRLHLGILQVTQPEKRVPYFVDPNTDKLLTESGWAQLGTDTLVEYVCVHKRACNCRVCEF